ncbi:MAG TPA: hypothetical protein VFV00_16100 [Acidimicrobiales bacterium]|nr:hypothetical protein [Acidimicrobiales bacterium]
MSGFAPNGVAGEPHTRLVIGVMGSASGPIDAATAAVARCLGRAIAEAGCTLITGGCPGLPQEAVLGAHAAGGLVVGISPALSETEHVTRYGSPIEGFDIMVYTGSGLMGREVVNIRSSDIVVIIGGQSGTLGEFAIAFDEGRLIGVLSGTGGIADLVPELLDRLTKDTGSTVLQDRDPARLIERLVEHYQTVHFRRPHRFADDVVGSAQSRRTRSPKAGSTLFQPSSASIRPRNTADASGSP